MFNFYRVAAAVPEVSVANVTWNVGKIEEKISDARAVGASIVAFPELCVSGYTCQDLFFQNTLIENVKEGVKAIITYSRGYNELVVIGAPLSISGSLYNCAIAIVNGTVLGISVKTFLPNYNEFYEKRWFRSATDLDTDSVLLSEVGLAIDEDYLVPVGNDIVYDLDGKIKVGIELCEDLWAPVPVSKLLALGGAEVILNLSASNEIIGKHDYRKNLVKNASGANICEYVYVSAGASESTQDLIFSGHSIIAENGTILNESRDYISDNYLLLADVDLEKIRADRKKSTTFSDNVSYLKSTIDGLRVLKYSDCDIPESDGTYLQVPKLPFIPSSKTKRLKRCTEIFDMQVSGLAKRLKITGSKPVVGVSGGMDSTLALLVSAMALKKLGRPSTDLVAITMPAFGTSDRTYKNSLTLIKALGTEPKVINIKASCEQHMKDIGHDPAIKDVTYENVQARERTQVLMDIANQDNGLVVGTGDLSELALGWCTYNGDQMSMYGVNGSIPKTLVRWLIDSCVETGVFPEASETLKDILDTPISPELLPPDENGNITQKTEDKVGPYELHDFFLYYTMRFGFSPAKIYYLAQKAFANDYTADVIKKWMTMFFRRFFNQQFKRSCMPDGIKLGTISLSPRGDLRMPSDANSAEWLEEIEALQ